jgi:hypothetical protein
MKNMDIDPLWRLADVLSLQDAAALIAGYDPNVIDICHNDTDFQQKYVRLYPVEKALVNAVLLGLLKTEKVSGTVYAPARLFDIIDTKGYSKSGNKISMSDTRVKVDDLREWLKGRGFTTGFFPLNQRMRLIFLTQTIRTMPQSWLQLSEHGRQLTQIPS